MVIIMIKMVINGSKMIKKKSMAQTLENGFKDLKLMKINKILSMAFTILLKERNTSGINQKWASMLKLEVLTPMA